MTSAPFIAAVHAGFAGFVSSAAKLVWINQRTLNCFDLLRAENDESTSRRLDAGGVGPHCRQRSRRLVSVGVNRDRYEVRSHTDTVLEVHVRKIMEK